MDSFVVLTIAIVSIIILIGFLLLVLVLRRTGAKTASRSTKAKMPNKGSGEYMGIPYQWQQSGAGQNKNPFFRLLLPCSLEGRLTVRRENAFDRLGKRLGLVSEITVNEGIFDSTFFIISTHPVFSSQLLSHSRVRAAVSRLLERGFTHLQMGPKGLLLSWSNYRPKTQAISKEDIEPLLTDLIEIRKGCERVKLSDEDREKQRSWKNKLTALYGLSASLGLSGLIALIWGLSAFPPLDPGKVFLFSLQWSILAFTLFVYLAYRSLKGNSTAHSHLLGLFFLALATFVLLGFGTSTFVNGRFDRSAAVPHSSLVLRKYTTQSKNNIDYHLVLNSWRPDRETEKKSVPRSFYEQISPNESRLELRTRSGYLGFEWLVSYRLE